ncbi:MAG: Mu-like prophage major head subunit gpT family protein [Fimbriimonadaceae bacterium]|nr:Mu-like prophage major head subunit gpT family protein [Fimbriimonadaceae bacterium]
MALTKSDLPDLLLPGLKAEFALAYRNELEGSITEAIATVVNTTQPIQKYGWLGTVPPMREFTDERRPSGLSAYAVSIEDKVFESSIAVERRAIEDDQLDLVRLRVRDLASRVGAHRHQMIVEKLANGFTELAYDGLSLFNTAHPADGTATYSNRTTDPLGPGALASAISTMMQVPDDQGIPLGVVPDTLLVGPKLQWTAYELVDSPVVIYKGNGADTAPSTPYGNAFHGKLKVVVSPFLRGGSDDYWFLLDTKRPIRSVLLQQRSDVPVEFSALESASGSEAAWMRDRYYYGVRARYNVGFGLWQTAFGAIL